MYYNNSHLNKADGVVVYINKSVIELTKVLDYGSLKILNSKLNINDYCIEVSSIYRSHDLNKKEFILNIKKFLYGHKNVNNHVIIAVLISIW